MHFYLFQAESLISIVDMEYVIVDHLYGKLFDHCIYFNIQAKCFHSEAASISVGL